MTMDGQHNNGSCNICSPLNEKHNTHSGSTDYNNLQRLAFCSMSTAHDGSHELTMQTLLQEQQQVDDVIRDGNSNDSGQAEKKRFHETGNSGY